MAKILLPCPTVLRQLVRCDPASGVIFWRKRSPYQFRAAGVYSAERVCNVWNAKHANKEAFTVADNHGYKCASIDGKKYKAHRVIWAIVHGKWPDGDIDHINGVTSDNRLSNLRMVTHRENMKNKKTPPNNTSGAMGVYWFKKYQNWCVKIGVKGKVLHVGYFDEFADAVAARKDAEVQHGFHRNHGR